MQAASATCIRASRSADICSLSTSHFPLHLALGTSNFALQRSCFYQLSQIVRRPPGQGEDRQRRVLLARARERRAVDNEDVLHFVHLVELVERRALRVLAHPAAPVLVDG